MVLGKVPLGEWADIRPTIRVSVEATHVRGKILTKYDLTKYDYDGGGLMLEGIQVSAAHSSTKFPRFDEKSRSYSKKVKAQNWDTACAVIDE
jgi:hypothetical protein